MAELHEGTMLSMCQLANKIKGTKTHVYLETECQKSYHSYVHRHASAGKTHILLDLFAKNTECTRGKKFTKAPGYF